MNKTSTPCLVTCGTENRDSDSCGRICAWLASIGRFGKFKFISPSVVNIRPSGSLAGRIFLVFKEIALPLVSAAAAVD